MGNAQAADAVERAGSHVGEPEHERRYQYSWVEDYLARLEGKEAREEYYARLEYEPHRPRGDGGGRLSG